MIAASFWQSLLEGFGVVLAFLYDVVRNYGLAIILLTVLVRVLLLPLTIKQTRSMQQMQQIQPMVKELQRKYKGNRQKMNEELMKLYKEHRVNPLGGCFPLILQFPVFIALYSVLRGDPGKAAARFRGVFSGQISPAVAHLPTGSALALAIQADEANFLGMNLACSPSTAGRASIEVAEGFVTNCGSTWVAAVPFYLLVALMVFTTWYQQRQMQAMSGQVNPQMQMMGRIMPIFLGFISLSIPAGVLLYWVTTNVWQVGQQYVMIRQRQAAADVSGDGRAGAKAKPVVEERKVGKDRGKPSPVAESPKRSKPSAPSAPSRSDGKSGKGGSRRNGSRKKRRKR